MAPVDGPEVVAGPERSSSWAVLGGAGVLALACLVADRAGQLLTGTAALVLAAAAVRDLVLRPVLHADAEGLSVVTGLRRRAVPWPEVERLRVVTDRRTPVLELDLGHTLVVLTRWRLGRAPALVLEQLRAVRP